MIQIDVWELPKTCDCDHCKGGKNKHAWSFYYFMKRKGDQPKVSVTRDHIRITREYYVETGNI